MNPLARGAFVNKIPQMNFFPLTWHESITNRFNAGPDEEPNVQIIETYGWLEDGSYTCLFIKGFTPFVYVKIRDVKNDIENISKLLRFKKIQPVKIAPARARGIYTTITKGDEDFCFISFKNSIDRAVANKLLSGSFQICENKASSVLQMTCSRNISTADWFMVSGAHPETENRRTICAAEYFISWKNLHPCTRRPDHIPKPLIMAYDIETFSHREDVFPNPKEPSDEIFQISCVFSSGVKILLTQFTPDLEYVDEDVKVYTFEKEADMLMFYRDIVVKYSPQILIGYNTFGFDNEYMVERARILLILDDFSRQGYTREKTKAYTSSWSSSAYSTQSFYYLDLKGRVHLDLLVYVKREYKLASYKLGVVATHFLGSTKDPFKVRHIRESYISGKAKHPEKSAALGLIGSYCIKDSFLVVRLLEYLRLWESSVSMASICQTSIIDLFTHGQTFKVFSQVYKFCLANRIVVENNSYKTDPDAIVEGAFVLQPLAGLYENVVSFDFASLYPSIIISHNIDFGTLVSADDTQTPDEKCNIIEWEEHYGCLCEGAKPAKKMSTGKKIVVCKSHRYRWLKEPRGVMPTIIENLIKARKSVRVQMKNVAPESAQHSLLNQFQLALKVSANSMYGSLASRFGLLQFLVGGMCVTAIGRRSVKRVVELMDSEYRAKVIYGDTDSAYVKFRDMPVDRLYGFCEAVSKKISEYFPRPMNLEFEGKVYQFYFIFSKKRYIYKLYGKEDLIVSGVLLKRRDSSLIVKEIYQNLIDKCLSRVKAEELWAQFLASLNILLSGYRSAEEYAIGKSVKTIESLTTIDEKGKEVPKIRDRSEKKVYFGDYVVPRLPEDAAAREKVLKKKGAVDDIDFYKKSLQSHVQLALKMRDRGQSIQNGSRLDFVYIKGSAKAPTLDKMEEIEYFQQTCSNSLINTAEYLRLLCETPLTELFRVYLGEDFSSFFKAIPIAAARKNEMIAELKTKLKPKVIFKD